MLLKMFSRYFPLNFLLRCKAAGFVEETFNFSIGNKKFSLLTILILISIIYFLPGLFSPRDFWIEDEARYAEIVREMMSEREWVIPHLNGHYYPDKPPLYFWLVILSSTVFGTISPFTFLFVTFLSAIGCIISAYYMGKFLFDSLSGFLASIVLTSSFLFIISTQIARMDMLFTLFIMLAVFSFYYAYKKKNATYYVVFYVLCGLSVFSKGPLGFLFSFLPPVLFFIYKKEYRELKKMILNRGFIIMLLLLSSWVSLVILTGHYDYIKIIIVEQILGRAVNSFIHKEPIYYYLLVFPFVFYPWIPFVPRSLFHLYSLDKDTLAFLLVWFISGFIVISIISGKLFIYLLPLFPPVALIVGKFFADIIRRSEQYGYDLRVEGTISCILFALMLIIFPFALNRFFPEEISFFMPLLIAFIPVLVLAFIFTMKRNLRYFLVLTVSAMFLFSSFSFGYAASRIDNYFSSRILSQKITELSEKGFVVTSLNVTRGILNFYADIYIKEMTYEKLKTLLSSREKVLCVIKEHELKRITKDISQQIHVVGEYDLSFEKYLLITNSP